ncbi:MAG: cytochrome c3 family protein [Myxococcales bacterium]|nr:cytochrome c3 family protein [Myxococcales bacterium]
MRTQTLVVLMILGASTSALGSLFFELGPSKVIFPEQTNPLIFSHDFHIREENKEKDIQGQGLDCDFCHEDMETSMLSSNRHIPDHEVCELCHDDWIGDEDEPGDPKDCARCHSDISVDQPDLSEDSPKGVAHPMSIPPPNIKFAHGSHIESGIDCLHCHPQVPKKKLAVRDDYPTMDKCIACHEKLNISSECATCHHEGANGTLIQNYASGTLKPQRYYISAIHDAHFLSDHAQAAQRERALCDSCHTPNDCMTCHDGVAWDRRYHPAAWMAQHSIRAKQNRFRCQSCHQLQSFCMTCHLQSGVASYGSLADPLARRTIRLSDRTDPTSPPVGPHPMREDGWLDRGSRNFHGAIASRNIRSCASCHQEQYCIQCHGSSTGRRINPHGPNAQRLKGSLAARQNARACLKCHNPSDSRWR